MRSWGGLAFDGTFPTVADPLNPPTAPYTLAKGSPQVWFSRPVEQIVCDVLNQWFTFYVVTAGLTSGLHSSDPIFHPNTFPYIITPPAVHTPPRGDLALAGHDNLLFGPLNFVLGSYYHDHDLN